MNKETNRQFFWFSLSALGVIVLAIYFYVISFSAPQNKNVTHLYYVDNISHTHQQLIAKFNKLNAGKIKVIPVNLPFSKFSTNERKEILARSLRSKSERIDVFAVDIIWTQRFAKWSYSLDRYFKSEEVNKFLKPSIETCFYKGQLVAAPLYLDIGLLYFREDLIQRLENGSQILAQLQKRISWQEFLSIGKELKKTGNPVFLFPANNFEGLMCVFYEFLTPEQIAATFLTNPIHLNKAEIKDALHFMQNLIYGYEFTPSVVTSFDEVGCYQYLLNHDAFFVRGWPGFELNVKEFNQLNHASVQINFTQVPYFKNKDTRPVYGGWNLMISENSSHKSEAIQFIRFLLKEENQKMLFTHGGYLPALKLIYEDQTLLKTYPHLKRLFQILMQGQHRPMRADYTRISDIMAFYIHKFLKKEMTIEQALQEAEKEINAF